MDGWAGWSLMEAVGQINNAGPQPIIYELPLNCLRFEGGLKTWWPGKTNGTTTQRDGALGRAHFKGCGSEVGRSPRRVFDCDGFMVPSRSTKLFLPS